MTENFLEKIITIISGNLFENCVVLEVFEINSAEPRGCM
jgi:hypothetical protein